MDRVATQGLVLTKGLCHRESDVGRACVKEHLHRRALSTQADLALEEVGVSLGWLQENMVALLPGDSRSKGD